MLLLVAAVAFFFLRVVPEPPSRRLFDNRRLVSGLRLVPVDADAVVMAPSAKGLSRALRGNRVTAAGYAELEAKSGFGALRRVPGELDLIAWRREGQLFYAVAGSKVQRSFITTALRLSPSAPTLRVDGEWLTTSPSAPSPPLESSELASMAKEGRGKLFLYLAPRERDFLAAPGNPAFLTVDLKQNRVEVHSRSRNLSPANGNDALPFAFPHSALLSMKLREVPSAIGEIEKLTRLKLAGLIRDGAMLSVYKVDDRKAIPRLQGTIVIPADQQKAAELALAIENMAPSIGGTLGRLLGGAKRRSERSGPDGTKVVRIESVGYTVEHALIGRELIVSLDKSSMDRYLIDRRSATPSSPQARWTMRLDDAELRRIAKVGENDALRLFAPELSRRIQELSRVSSLIPEGCLLEATSTVTVAYEEIFATVTAK